MINRSSWGKRARFVRQLRSELLEARYAMDGSCAGTNATLEVTPPLDYFLNGSPATASNPTPTLALGPVSIANVPAYSSLPGAADTLYLDFNGHFEATWGSYSNATTPAYSTDSDFTTFSDQEQANIQAIWNQVAEDYAPFNINVTTVEPASFANGVALRVAIGGSSSDWFGSSAGGVAYINTYTNSIVNTVYVFPAQLANGNAKYVGEASSHEAGHAFGLQHQSSYDANGNLLASYYAGANGKAPIMGNSYSATRGLWWNGTTSSATTIQDDMSLIARSTNTFGYRPDDHGNTATTATALTINGNTFSAGGVITQTSDVDVFSFTTNPGTISLNVTLPSNNNLDSILELQTATGTILATAAPTNSFGASLTFNITTAGAYRLAVKSQGNYGDVGRYTVSGSVVPFVVDPVAAPTNLTAAVSTGTNIVLNWNDNATNETAYIISRSVNGGTSWTTLATLSAGATSFVDTTSTAGQTVSYQVQAVNGTNVSDFSNTAEVTLAPATPANVSAAAGTAGVIQLSWSDVSGEANYKILRSLDNITFTQVATANANATAYNDSGLAAGTTYYYQVVASNAGGDSAASAVASATTITVNVVTIPTSPNNLRVASNLSTGVTLNWSDRSSNESGFYVERRLGSSGAFTVVGTVGQNVTSFTDTAIAARTRYSYRVRAFNAAGVSAASKTVSVTTLRNLTVAARSSTSVSVVTTSISRVNQNLSDDPNLDKNCDKAVQSARELIFSRLSDLREDFWESIWSR